MNVICDLEGDGEDMGEKKTTCTYDSSTFEGKRVLSELMCSRTSRRVKKQGSRFTHIPGAGHINFDYKCDASIRRILGNYRDRRSPYLWLTLRDGKNQLVEDTWIARIGFARCGACR